MLWDHLQIITFTEKIKLLESGRGNKTLKAGIILDNDLSSDNRVLKELEILRKNGIKVHVLCFAFGNKQYNDIEGIEITRIKISRRLKDILFFLVNLVPVYEFLWMTNTKKFIRKNKPDIIHTHDLYMARAVSKGLRSTGGRPALILDLHENFPYSIATYNWTKGMLRKTITKPYKWLRKEPEYLDYADSIVVLSEEYKSGLTAKYPNLKKKIFCILPNVPDIDMFAKVETNKKLPASVNDRINIFYYGVVAERRGIFDALNVFAELISENYNMEFTIIGPVDRKDRNRFFNILNEVQLKGRISHIPWINHKELYNYLSKSDICIAPFLRNPQHESGVANKVFEYMLGGKPLLVSDCLPQQKLIESTKCGLVYKNIPEFKEAMIKLSADPEMRRVLGQNGREAIINKYNMGMFQVNLLDLYHKMFRQGKYEYSDTDSFIS